MQRVGDSTGTANAAGEFTQGQPGSGIDATMITVAWLNAIQRELISVISGANIPLDPADNSQLLKAIQAIQAAANTWAKLGAKPTTIAGFGITDSFTKTETSNAIQQAIAALVASSPAALDTLKELADALGNDPNFATTMTNSLASKAAKASTLAGYGISDAYTKAQTYSVAEVVAAITQATAQATEAARGTAKIATQDQVNSGTDDAAYVTAKKIRFGFAISLAATGFIAFPSWMGGLIIQWGSVAATNVTFPLQFPANLLFLSLSANNYNSTGALAAQYQAVTASSTTGFTAAAILPVPALIKWLAIGN